MKRDNFAQKRIFQCRCGDGSDERKIQTAYREVISQTTARYRFCSGGRESVL